MSVEADTAGAIAWHEADAVATLMHSLQTRGVRRASGAHIEEWRKAMAASGLDRTYSIPTDAWAVLHVDRTAQDSRDDEDTIETVAELAAATLSAPQRLQLAQFLLATVAVDVADVPAIDRPVAARAAGTRQADLDTAKKSILDSLEMINSKEVARILAPTSEANRSVAQKRRAAGDLIGLPIGTRPNYLYPAFQFDTQRHKIHDVVRHANRRLYVDSDPYGAASWWLTPVEVLDWNSPFEDLEAGNLTVIAVDNVIDHARQGM